MIETKLCPKCNEVKPFSKNQWSCKDCCADDKYQYRYGISRDDYYTLLTKQNFRCGVCGIHTDDVKTNRNMKSDRRFVVDHDHTDGQVRGLLCNHCNVMIGNARDNVGNLQKGIEYLNRMKI